MKVVVTKKVKSTLGEIKVGGVYDTYTKHGSIYIKSIYGYNLAIGRDSELWDGFVWLSDYRSEMIDKILND